MPEIDSVLRNWGNHATSGLSNFLQLAYDACEREGITSAAITILPAIGLPVSLGSDLHLRSSVEELQRKFFEILGKESRMPVDLIDSLVVELDFAPHVHRVAARRLEYEVTGSLAYYRYDPVYRCVLSLRLMPGQEHVCTFEK